MGWGRERGFAPGAAGVVAGDGDEVRDDIGDRRRGRVGGARGRERAPAGGLGLVPWAGRAGPAVACRGGIDTALLRSVGFLISCFSDRATVDHLSPGRSLAQACFVSRTGVHGNTIVNLRSAAARTFKFFAGNIHHHGRSGRPLPARTAGRPAS